MYKLVSALVVACILASSCDAASILEVRNQTEWDILFKEAFNTPGIWENPSNNQYTYSQSSGHFSGGGISTTACSGRAGHCRNNPSCQCEVAVGPLPRGGYRLSGAVNFKGMYPCYVLTQVSGNACGRSGFLIHGGNCADDPSEGCIVIESNAIRAQIAGGSSLNVVQ